VLSFRVICLITFQFRFGRRELFLGRYHSGLRLFNVGGSGLQLARRVRGCYRNIDVKRLGGRFGIGEIARAWSTAT